MQSMILERGITQNLGVTEELRVVAFSALKTNVHCEVPRPVQRGACAPPTRLRACKELTSTFRRQHQPTQQPPFLFPTFQTSPTETLQEPRPLLRRQRRLSRHQAAPAPFYHDRCRRPGERLRSWKEKAIHQLEAITSTRPQGLTRS